LSGSQCVLDEGPFFISFFNEILWVEILTSPAIWTGNQSSKRVILSMPDLPAIMASQFFLLPVPRGDTTTLSPPLFS
jgi:hypothetical protein